MKVALFGGSFNPIHNAHLEIARKLIDKDIVDEVWFVPCGNHPFDKKLVNGGDRTDMIKLSIDKEDRFKVLDKEVESSDISFTSTTIKELKKEFDRIDFYFIIGADNLRDIQKWNDYKYLRKNVNFILVKRPKFKILGNPEINISYLLEFDDKTSSTLIRNRLTENLPIGDLVSSKVKEYIEKEGIYNGKTL